MKHNLNNANENINNLAIQRKEDQKKVQDINENVESLNSTTKNLNDEIDNLKQSIKDKEDSQQKMVTSQSKNIEYIQKVLTKHEKHLKALIEKKIKRLCLYLEFYFFFYLYKNINELFLLSFFFICFENHSFHTD